MPDAPLTVAEVAIRRDEVGRFCLNDLHRAAGCENKHRPSLWMENLQTQELARQVERKAGIPALATQHGGSTPGTYVAKQLVYAYAMWISAKFHLQVIEAYDALVTAPPVDPLRALNDPATLRTLLNEYAGRVLALEHEVQEAKPKVEAFDRLAAAEGALNFTEAAKQLKVKPKYLLAWLEARDWIFRRAGNWRAKSRRLDQGYLAVRSGARSRSDGSTELYEQAMVTAAGLAAIAKAMSHQASDNAITQCATVLGAHA